jgi:methionyl-tRNA formyltransferase
MKIIFMGTPQFSVPILKALHEKYQVALVVTQPDKEIGRKKVLTSPPVKKLAQSMQIPVFQPKKLRDDYKIILDIQPDLIITAAYGQILPKAVLDSARIAAINVHASLLPKLRGGAPIQRAIERQYIKTGVTIMHMSMKMDEGDIISQQATTIDARETSGTLFEKLSFLGRDLLLATLPSIIDKSAPCIPQNHKEATYAYNLKKEEEHLYFNQNTAVIDAKVRAFLPDPATYALIDGKRLKILWTEIPSEQESFPNVPPGTICYVSKKHFAVKTNDGAIWIRKVQLEGKKPMDSHAFLQGSGKNLIQIHKVFQ